jgi:hypothetical protein
VRIPFVGNIIAALAGEKAAELPKAHVATRRLGTDPKGLQARKWWYRDGGVQEGYDTRQVFSNSYPHGAFSYLSPWHTHGRFAEPRLSFKQRAAKWLQGPPRVQPKPKLPDVQAIMKLAPDVRIRLAPALPCFRGAPA